VTNAPFVRQSKPIPIERRGFGFPKSHRILRSSDFRKVYDNGFRFSCSLFTAFCLAETGQEDGPKVGFTVPRAVGKSVVRNRIRRRMREAVRLHLGQLGLKWRVVFNPRRTVLAAETEAIEKDVERLFARCANS
jgi:ribonuclease P protein component